LRTLLPVAKVDVEDIQCAVTSSEKHIISLSLNGKLNLWNLDSLEENKLPDQVLNGHQNYVSRVIYHKENNSVISADFNGKICNFFNKNSAMGH
jgi:WD40 repeat protein